MWIVAVSAGVKADQFEAVSSSLMLMVDERERLSRLRDPSIDPSLQQRLFTRRTCYCNRGLDFVVECCSIDRSLVHVM